MKTLIAALTLGTAFAAAVPPALADQVSYQGSDSFSSSALSFGTVTQNGTASGIFSSFAGTSATFYGFDFASYTTAQTILSDTSGGNTLTYVLSTSDYDESLTPVTTPGAPAGEDNLTITGIGTYYLNGTEIATGSFDLTTQGIPGDGNSVTFSDTSYTTSALTPEPSSLMLLGTGLAGAAGVLLRRKRAINAS